MSNHGTEVPIPCCRCGLDRDRWDRIAGKTYCPNCQEDLAMGEGEPLIYFRGKTYTALSAPG